MNTSIDLGDLSARLDYLKVAYDTEIQGADCKQTPFPLAYLLLLHYKSCKKETYWAERIKGLELLCKWLSPITYTPLVHPPHLFFPLVIYTPHELSEMEYYTGIAERSIVECTVISVLPNLLPK